MAGRATRTTRTTHTTRPPATDRDRLGRYRSIRDFDKTSEPAGSAPSGTPLSGGRYVVQRHRAHALHYDFRLEMDGVLVSWAVPKGPSLDPARRSLAVHVEDHPIEYIDFEGVIPSGEYGGGDVIVWDRGTWEPAKDDTDPVRAVADGELHFDLDGEKLQGRFILVRDKRDKRGGRGKEQWLLFHKKDEFTVAGWDVEEHPRSVKSGRTNDEVPRAPDARWHSDRAASSAEERLDGGADRFVAVTPDELEALDAMGAKGAWLAQGRELHLTNLDKVLFPRKGRAPSLTKRDLIRHYARVAHVMLPYLEGRPVNLHRFPDGIGHKGFWNKAYPPHAPEWLTPWHNEEADPGETERYAVLDDVPSVLFMANYGAIELHPWTSRIPSVHEPTWAFVDIDPGPATEVEELLVLARLYRTALDHLGVVGGPKVTGQRGIQVWIPIGPGSSFDDTRGWVEQLSRAVGATVPELVSWSWQKKDRSGLARLDYTQNAINKTLVAPWSARPAPGAPVSVPITWEELDDPDLRPDAWTVADVPDRLVAAGDALAPLIGLDQQLPPL